MGTKTLLTRLLRTGALLTATWSTQEPGLGWGVSPCRRHLGMVSPQNAMPTVHL